MVSYTITTLTGPTGVLVANKSYTFTVVGTATGATGYLRLMVNGRVVGYTMFYPTSTSRTYNYTFPTNGVYLVTAQIGDKVGTTTPFVVKSSISNTLTLTVGSDPVPVVTNPVYTVGPITGPYASAANASSGSSLLTSAPKGYEYFFRVPWTCSNVALNVTPWYDWTNGAGNWVPGTVGSGGSGVSVTSYTFGAEGTFPLYAYLYSPDDVSTMVNSLDIVQTVAGGTIALSATKSITISAGVVTPPVDNTTSAKVRYEVMGGDGSAVVSTGVLGDVYIPENFNVKGLVIVGDGQAGTATVVVTKSAMASVVSGTALGTTVGSVSATNAKYGSTTAFTTSSIAGGDVLRFNLSVCSVFKRVTVAIYGTLA